MPERADIHLLCVLAILALIVGEIGEQGVRLAYRPQPDIAERVGCDGWSVRKLPGMILPSGKA